MLSADSAFRSNFHVEGVLHYCVANVPGAVPRTSTFALTSATLPYALKLANNGLQAAVAKDEGLKPGVNTYAGKLTYEAVAVSQNKSTRRWMNCCDERYR
ncbi:MAG TPA: hypothetical protein VGQ72_08790 [Pyrinomonadaceae bacterium]|jgi:alanine dehydrogenase|nr:hypothetical protein [Pyrinomonadaceae bacterium]